MKYLIHIITLCFISYPLMGQINFSPGTSIKNPKIVKLDSLIKAGEYENIRSLVIAQHGKVLFESYYRGYDKSTQHNARSATKTLATLLAGVAYGDGHIKSEKDPIMKYLQHKRPIQNPDPRKEAVTIEDCMTMSSVMESDDNNQFSRGHEERMYIIEDWTQFFLDLPVRSYTFNPLPEELPYGRSFSYASASAAVVAEVIQSAVGKPVHQYLEERILTPLDIKGYALDFTPMKILNTAGGSGYTSRHFLKFIQLIHNEGKWNGQQLIPQDWMQKATSPQVQAWPGMDYGYFLWLAQFGPEDQKVRCNCMNGNGGNRMISIPELDATIVVTTTNYGNRNAHNYVDEMLNKYIIPSLMEE